MARKSYDKMYEEKKEVTEEIHIKTTEIETVKEEEATSPTTELSKEIIKVSEIEEAKTEVPQEDNKEKNKDTEFYSKSMDLTEEDLMDDEFVDDKLPIWVKILIFLLIIAITAVVGYLILQRIK